MPELLLLLLLLVSLLVMVIIIIIAQKTGRKGEVNLGEATTTGGGRVE